jgi:S-disulfanyl-L-cysteine oxidoreductase SoxD
MRAGRKLGLAIAIGLAAGFAAPARLAPQAAPAKALPAHFADADNPAAVALGERLYAGHCASCHGHYREGQPLWQLIDAYAGRRAPAFDETGYTWQRSDEAIFHMTKYGRYAAAPSAGVSYMPAFKGVLADPEILAAIAFIKARWPIGLRIAQAMLNPGFTGMPADADNIAWRLPPSCDSMFRRSGTAARRPR